MNGRCPGDALSGQHLGHSFGTSIRMILHMILMLTLTCIEIVNANLTCVLKLPQSGILPTSLKEILISIVPLLGSKPGNNINVVIDNEVVVSTDCLK